MLNLFTSIKHVRVLASYLAPVSKFKNGANFVDRVKKKKLSSNILRR